MMKSINYWADQFSVSTDIRFITRANLFTKPRRIDEKTLVFLGSHSGTTPEVVESVEFLKAKPCKTLAFTQQADSPLGKSVQQVFAYGKTNQGYFSSLMIALAFISGFMKKKEKLEFS